LHEQVTMSRMNTEPVVLSVDAVVNPNTLEPELLHVSNPDVAEDLEVTFRTGLNPLVKEFTPNLSTDVISWLRQGQIQNAQLIEAVRLPSSSEDRQKNS